MATKKLPRSIRTESWIRQRPWLSMASVATTVAIITAVAPGIFWVKSYFQTADEAKEESIRNARRDAWMRWNLLDIRSTLARNRVWECDAKKQKQHIEPMVPIEIVNCNQYTRDYDAAERRAIEAYNEAMKLGKE